jgi:hypothetical protein
MPGPRSNGGLRTQEPVAVVVMDGKEDAQAVALVLAYGMDEI